MQTTSALYKTIVAGEHWFESKIVVNGNTVEGDELLSLERDREGMSERLPTVGGALASTLNVRMREPSFTIPKMGEVDVYIRALNSTQTSEWLAAGVYFVDTREHSDSAQSIQTVTLFCYDAMMKAEQDYPDTSHNWPYLDTSVVSEIATTIGVTVDSRVSSYLTAGYYVDLPISYTMREVLEHIAASYGGNFVITAENKLMFVPLYGLDPDVTGRYLADESDGTTALMFGNEGWYILV